MSTAANGAAFNHRHGGAPRHARHKPQSPQLLFAARSRRTCDRQRQVDPLRLLRKLEVELKKEVCTCGRPVGDNTCEATNSGFASIEEFGSRVLGLLWSDAEEPDGRFRHVGKRLP